jgi:hypothetical protein
MLPAKATQIHVHVCEYGERKDRVKSFPSFIFASYVVEKRAKFDKKNQVQHQDIYTFGMEMKALLSVEFVICFYNCFVNFRNGNKHRRWRNENARMKLFQDSLSSLL